MAIRDEIRCTAKSKQRQDRCLQPRVPGTDKCRFHGGKRGALKHGLASKYGPPPALRERIEAYEKDPRLLSHVRIGAHMQALLDVLYAKAKDDEAAIDGELVESLRAVLAELRKAATDWHRLAVDNRFVDLVEARQLFGQALERVLRHVPEDRHDAALRDFQDVIGDLGGGGGEDEQRVH